MARNLLKIPISATGATMSNESFEKAEARMVAEFIHAGHTSLNDPTPDDLHPLYGLFLETQNFLSRYCQGPNYDKGLRRVNCYRSSLHIKLMNLNLKARQAGFDILLQKDLPSNAELLALRFAAPRESDNRKIFEPLTTLDMIHLWRVPSHTDAEAKMPETNDDAEDSSTEGAPTEGDSNFETALKVELADAERKIKAIQDAKKDLKSKLAMVEEAESAVLQARDAMAQTQNAMAKADLALLQTPISFLVEDN